MKIPKEKLGQFGISIKVNRKERLRKYSGASWTQKGFCDGICSEASLVNMEKGNPGRFLENYAIMAEKLGMRVCYDPKVDNKIDNCLRNLSHYVDFFDKVNIDKITTYMMELLEPLRNCLWYEDLYRAIIAINQHYIKGNFTTATDRDVLCEMTNEFTNDLSDIIKSIVFWSSYWDIETEDYTYFYKKFDIKNNKSASNKVNTLMFLFAEEDTSSFRKLYDEVRIKWINDGNYLRLLDAYNMALLLSSLCDANEVDEIASAIQCIMRDKVLPNSKKAESYYSLGIAYYQLKNYEKCIEMMDLCYKFDTYRTQLTFIYSGHSQRMLGYDVIIPFFSSDELNKFPQDVYFMYEYFSKSLDYPIYDLERILMENILPNLNTDDEIVINILREELDYIVERTKHYKNLMIFNKKAKKLMAHIK